MAKIWRLDNCSSYASLDITGDTGRKEEGIGIARATGKSAMENMHLKRAHSKNGGDTRMPQDPTWKIF